MSIQAVAWVLDQYIPNPIAKLVLVSLANHANHVTGHCYPSVELIAHEASCSVRSVQRYIPYLVEHGFIRVDENFKNGRQTANTYWLLIASPDPTTGTSGGDRMSPLGGKPTPAVIDGGATAVTPKNHHKNHQLPPKSPSASSVESSTRGLSRKDRARSSNAPMPTQAISESNNERRKDRGQYEVAIANRLGECGWEILTALPEAEVERLCDLQRRGILDEAALHAVKMKHLHPDHRTDGPSPKPNTEEMD